jgi:hypothetical protein
LATYVPIFQSLITATGVVAAAVVAAILARRSYVKQKERDREEDVRLKRAEEYERYIKAFREVAYHAKRLQQSGPDDEKTEWFLGEARAKYDAAYNYLIVIASDRVYSCASALQKRLSTHFDGQSIDTDKKRDDEEIKNLYTKLIFAMRKDCFEPTKLSKEQINPQLNW